MSLSAGTSATGTGLVHTGLFGSGAGTWGVRKRQEFEIPAAGGSELLDLSHAVSDADEAELQAMRRALSTKLNIGRQTENVEILRQRPNNPLYSVKTFEELRLPEPLLFGLYDLNFRAPSRIQETALPILLAHP